MCTTQCVVELSGIRPIKPWFNPSLLTTVIKLCLIMIRSHCLALRIYNWIRYLGCFESPVELNYNLVHTSILYLHAPWPRRTVLQAKLWQPILKVIIRQIQLRKEIVNLITGENKSLAIKGMIYNEIRPKYVFLYYIIPPYLICNFSFKNIFIRKNVSIEKKLIVKINCILFVWIFMSFISIKLCTLFFFWKLM